LPELILKNTLKDKQPIAARQQEMTGGEQTAGSQPPHAAQTKAPKNGDGSGNKHNVITRQNCSALNIHITWQQKTRQRIPELT
jgi:hypothetical protein